MFHHSYIYYFIICKDQTNFLYSKTLCPFNMAKQEKKFFCIKSLPLNWSCTPTPPSLALIGSIQLGRLSGRLKYCLAAVFFMGNCATPPFSKALNYTNILILIYKKVGTAYAKVSAIKDALIKNMTH